VWGPFALDALSRLNLGRFEPTRIHVSTDNRTFQPLPQFPLVLQKLEQAAAASVPKKPSVSTSAVPEPPPPPKPPKPRTTPAAVAEDPAPPAEGVLEKYSVINLYARAASLQLTGLLSIGTEEGVASIAFKKGTPEAVTLPRPAEVLANFLRDKGALTPTAAEQALAAADGPNGDLIHVLIPLGFLQPNDLFPLLGEYNIAALGKVLTLESGPFSWANGMAPPAGSFSLGDRWALLSQWGRTLGTGIVRRRLGDRMHRAVYSSSGARATNEQLKLTAQEIRVLPYFDGTRSPEQITMELMGESDVIYRLAFMLGEIGNLSFGPELRRVGHVVDADAPAMEKVSAGEERKAATPEAPTIGKVAVKTVAAKVEAAPPKPIAPPPSPPAAAAKPPPPAAAAKPTPPARPPPPPQPTRPPPVMGQASHTSLPPVPRPKPAETEDASALQALLDKWKKATHFEVLGVDRKANAEAIKNAYFALARQHHPDTVIGTGESQLRQLKADLTARINEAYSSIGDDASRQKYLAELKEGEKVDIGPVVQAEEDFLRATIMVKARKFVEAVDLLDRAIALNPNEPEFFAWRAWARFVNAQDKRAEYPEAVAVCNKVLKESPMCAAAALFIGNMSKIVGETAKAEAAFRKVLEIEPDHIDAARELRMAGKR
jgi:outer membrane biosynthesis protein TonB